MIWFKAYSLEKIKEVMETNMVHHLGIEITAIGEDYLEGTMPVDNRTHQPLHILHGGASVVLAESLGSIAANLVIDNDKYIAVGLDVNASHIKTVRNGYVKATARAKHIGRTTQIWSIDITTPSGSLVCQSRLTMAVLEKGRKSMGFQDLNV